MHTFLGLDGAGRALDFPQGRVLCPLLGLEGEEEGESGSGRKMKRGEEVEIFNGIIYKAKIKIKKIHEDSSSPGDPLPAPPENWPASDSIHNSGAQREAVVATGNPGVGLFKVLLTPGC